MDYLNKRWRRRRERTADDLPCTCGEAGLSRTCMSRASCECRQRNIKCVRECGCVQNQVRCTHGVLAPLRSEGFYVCMSRRVLVPANNALSCAQI